MPATLLAALVLGHVLGDFVFQTSSMVRRKLAGEPRAFLTHVAVVSLCQAATLVPVWPTLSGVWALGALTVSHLLIDVLKTVASRRWPARDLAWFFLDQAAHVGVLLATGLALADSGDVAASWVGSATVALVAWAAAALAIDVWAGLVIVSVVLRALRPAEPGAVEEAERSSGGAPAGDAPTEDAPTGDAPAGDAPAGRWIGILERLIVTLAVLQGEWGAIGLVLTAKSIARFKELEDRSFSEVYLVGTMTSVLVAIGSGLLLRAQLG